MNRKSTGDMLQKSHFHSLNKVKTLFFSTIWPHSPPSHGTTPQQQPTAHGKMKPAMKVFDSCESPGASDLPQEQPSHHLDALRELCQIDIEESKSRVWSNEWRQSKESVSGLLKSKMDLCWQTISSSSLFSSLATDLGRKLSDVRLERPATADLATHNERDEEWLRRGSNVFSIEEQHEEYSKDETENYSRNYSLFVHKTAGVSKSASINDYGSMFNCDIVKFESSSQLAKNKLRLTAGPVDARCFAHVCLQYFVESKQLRVILVQIDNIPNTKRKTFAKLCLKVKSKWQSYETKLARVNDQVARFQTEVFFTNWGEEDFSDAELLISLYKKRRFLFRSKFVCGVVLPLGDLDLNMDTTMRVGLQENLSKQPTQRADVDFEIISQDRSIRANAVAALGENRRPALRRCQSLPSSRRFKLL